MQIVNKTSKTIRVAGVKIPATHSASIHESFVDDIEGDHTSKVMLINGIKVMVLSDGDSKKNIDDTKDEEVKDNAKVEVETEAEVEDKPKFSDKKANKKKGKNKK